MLPCAQCMFCVGSIWSSGSINKNNSFVISGPVYRNTVEIWFILELSGRQCFGWATGGNDWP